MEEALKQPLSTKPLSDALSGAPSLDHWRIAGFVIIGVALVIGALFAPAFPFTSDGAIHAEMARAFAENGAFYIAQNGGVDGAPALQQISTHVLGDVAYPQYPSGYGVVAAPFYAALGLRGLVIFNAISAALALLLTYRIAITFYGKSISILSVAILAVATFYTNYAFGIWPHMFSLFVWLAIIFLAVIADDADKKRIQLTAIAAAGILVGFGACVRVDIILAAPVIFLWLRLFARPGDRTIAIAFIVALAPGLIAAATMNDAKFGVFSPFYYGPNPGPDSLSRYLWLAPLLVISGLALLTVNAPKTITALRKKFSDRHLLIALAISAIVAIGVGFSLISTYLYSLYVLVVDLQMYNGYYVQEGIARDDYGYLLFWGFPKRALLQSLPYAALLILPLVEIFRLKKLKQHSLCALVICAPICFYGLNQWHGGGSYNMRYFIPAIPFIAILSAYSLIHIIRSVGAVNRTQVLAAGAAGALMFVALDTIRQDIAPHLFAPLALYPQLALAVMLGVAMIVFIATRKQHKRISQVTLAIAVLSLSYGAMINLADEAAHEKTRAEQLALSQAVARVIPNDALIFSQLKVLTIQAERAGASVMYTTEKNLTQSIEALSAFEHAGRCVYFQNSKVAKLLLPVLPEGAIHPIPAWAGRQAFPDDPRLAFYVLASQRDQCAF